MLYDAHVHSAASPDSEADPVEVISTLKSKGLGTTFTEHVDFAFPTTGRDITANDVPKIARDFVCDFDMYPAQYRKLRSDTVLLGLEIGLTAAYLELNTQVAGGDFDFILGSIHYVDGIDMFYDAKKYPAEEFFRRFLAYSTEMVELCGFFDAFAHIDYITRYSDDIDRIFDYYDYAAEFDALLKLLVDRGSALEINTARLGSDKAVRQLMPIYKRFRELGGRYSTLGSDSHDLAGLGRNFDRGLEIAAHAGLTPVYFKERKRVVCVV